MKKTLTLICVLALNTIVFGQTDWFSNINICETQDTTIAFPSGDYDDYTFNWYLDGDSLTTDSNISILSSGSGLYTLTLYGTDTLSSEFNAIVDVENPDFMLTLTDSDINVDLLVNTCIEDSPILATSQEANTYLWYVDGSPIETNSPSEKTLPIEDVVDEIEFNQEYEYHIEVENACGTYPSKNTVNMVVNECHCALDMPNVFSPNNDTENDVFKPINNHELETDAERICKSTNFKMEVFSQWGRHMATVDSGNEYPSWDGLNKKGNEVAAGVYFYNIVYQVNVYTLPKEKEITGSFNLYR
ncbi:MAG: gliding motility-associated C-terminal domain-containing protein [Flavobacteriales bacterium]|nr:gliding motility-associated C-terminal domain-containing protein [Flavobacteriales bacterium]